MEPFVVDPCEYDKNQAFQAAIGYVTEFLLLNGLDMPATCATVSRRKSRCAGWYKFDTHEMFVDVAGSRPPVKTPGFAWSFTGYKCDLTAPGVLAHETGHHVHNMINGIIDKKHAKIFLHDVRLFMRHEAPASGYEPNSYEAFAEAMRLFILNPELLREGRPLRWRFITGMGLKPPHDCPWQEVLANAHPRLVSAAGNWIRQGKR